MRLKKAAPAPQNAAMHVIVPLRIPDSSIISVVSPAIAATRHFFYQFLLLYFLYTFRKIPLR